ncbi:antiviral reverse transcriptase Drt3a [Achromobacter xylosoxidans]|uniref:antiviral reverse transcriptase Drt3a n=1 Tax=Alcaligenes xylosoxydans xylosoxydans TaxID=85698 RepID=UPI0006C16EDF|nr:antiviral reverse transcriptase Drt3a [Achromobacter xylosoxidans]CUJ60804.1 Retron-type reverse transcriptase [Achromobacter xylosoxidans]
MHDQSFNEKTLAQAFNKPDFVGITAPAHLDAFREDMLSKAITCSTNGFVVSANPLTSFPLNGRRVFIFQNLWEELVARKLCINIKKVTRVVPRGRTQIVSNLRLLLEEGVPFRVYRLDIKSFYESFKASYVISKVNEIIELSPLSKRLLQDLLSCHAALGGTGIPRGLALSAVLVEHLMKDFDYKVASHPEVFFFSRYVDDIIIVTSARENEADFVRQVKNFLPSGLNLNPSKRQIVGAENRVSPTRSSAIATTLFQFDYLGYSFKVSEPEKNSDKSPGAHHRNVVVDIADKKISRFKKRISRSFLDFFRTGDFSLLQDRIRFLTKNFSVYNAKAGGKKIAGIFHSYPLAATDAGGMAALDRFLKDAILSRTGRISSRTFPLLTGAQKRRLLSNSFTDGHKKATFVHFSGTRLKEIQMCWKY